MIKQAKLALTAPCTWCTVCSACSPKIKSTKQAADSLNGGKTENGVKSCPQLDRVELELIEKARERAMKALTVWRMPQISVTPKSHGLEHHACDQLELLQGLLADFCEDWVEQLHQLGLKNNRRTKGVRDRDQKHGLRAKWEQLSGNRNVQRMKVEVKESWKRKVQHDRGAETAANLLVEKTFHREPALSQDNLQWTGVNRLLKLKEIVILDEEEWVQLNRQHHTSLFVTMV
jgi:hypothetical protein